MSGYVPDPALEDATWTRIVCSCGTGIALTNGLLLRYRCIDRRCRRPGEARLAYIRLATNEEVAHTYVPVRVERQEHNHGW